MGFLRRSPLISPPHCKLFVNCPGLLRIALKQERNRDLFNEALSEYLPASARVGPRR